VRFAASPLVNCRGHKTRADHSASATGADLIVLAIQISALFSFGRRSRDQKNSTNPENPLSAWFTVMDRLGRMTSVVGPKRATVVGPKRADCSPLDE
jgi:hypothetical protein